MRLCSCFFLMFCKWNSMKISDNNNLLKDFSAKCLTHNISLILYNSHKDKLVQKYMNLLKTCFDCTFFPTYFAQTHYMLKSDLNKNKFAVIIYTFWIYIIDIFHCPYPFFYLRLFLPLSYNQFFCWFHQKNCWLFLPQERCWI